MDLNVVGPIIGVVVLLVLLVLLVTSRYKVAGPNQAFIVTGRKGKAVLNPETGQLTTDLSGQKVVLGGGVFVVPFIQKLATMDLSSRRISVQIRGAVSGQGIKLNLDGVAIVKVGGNADQIRLGAQRFLSQQADIEAFTQEVLAGALRSIVGGLTVEQIIRDRAAFAQRVADESESSLTGQGLILDAFQIQDVTDDGTYLADLGRPEAARISRPRRSPRRTPARRPSRRGSPRSRRSRSPSGRWPSSRPRSRPRPTPRPPRPRRPARSPRPSATRRSSPSRRRSPSARPR